MQAQVHDSNSGFLCSEMRAIGWSVGRIVTVLDDVEAIAAEVRQRKCVLDVPGSSPSHLHACLSVRTQAGNSTKDTPAQLSDCCIFLQISC